MTYEQCLNQESGVLWDALEAIRKLARRLQESGGMNARAYAEIEELIRAAELVALNCWRGSGEDTSDGGNVAHRTA